LVWALFGIRSAFADIPLIATVAVIAAILIVGLAFLGYFRTGKSDRTLKPKMA
jgi:hypothetical protein